MEPGTRVRLLIDQHGMDGLTRPGTLGTVLAPEDRHGEVARYQYEGEFAVGWDNAETLSPEDPGWFYYLPAEAGIKWELA